MQDDEEGQEHPIAYFSRILTSAERNYSVTERELSVLLSIDHFRAYIEGMTFTVVTDHASLKWLMGLSNSCSGRPISGRSLRNSRGSPGGYYRPVVYTYLFPRRFKCFKVQDQVLYRFCRPKNSQFPSLEHRTMRQDQYLKVLQRRMLPQVQQWFPNGDYTFMHDTLPQSQNCDTLPLGPTSVCP